MINTNVTHFRKNVSTLLEQTLKLMNPSMSAPETATSSSSAKMITAAS